MNWRKPNGITRDDLRDLVLAGKSEAKHTEALRQLVAEEKAFLEEAETDFKKALDKYPYSEMRYSREVKGGFTDLIHERWSLWEVGDHTMTSYVIHYTFKEEAEIVFSCEKLTVTVSMSSWESNGDWKDYADISGDYDEMDTLCAENDEDFDGIILDSFQPYELCWVAE